MYYFRAFVAGLIVPSLILPIVILVILHLLERPDLLTLPFLHTIPLIWGLWNVLYFAWLKNILPGDENSKLLITGALLGLFLVSYGIWILHLPEKLSLPFYLPLFLGPLVYALLWRFFVKPLNTLLGLSS